MGMNEKEKKENLFQFGLVSGSEWGGGGGGGDIF